MSRQEGFGMASTRSKFFGKRGAATKEKGRATSTMVDSIKVKYYSRSCRRGWVVLVFYFRCVLRYSLFAATH
jgi:hypothetical protein